MAHNEFDRIARLTRRFGGAHPPDIGIGDDCAIVHPRGAALVTVDCAVEGVHFRRDMLSLREAAARAIEAAVSDVAAMGGSVRGAGCGLLLAWTLPDTLDDEDFDALIAGSHAAASRLETHVLGGNLARAPALTLTTTVLGLAPMRPVLRRGARPGDVVVTTGRPGAAGLGLRALLGGHRDARLAPYIECWRAPRARTEMAQELARAAHAAIDLSDGLAQDASHLASASGCAIEFDTRSLTLDDAFCDAARIMGRDPLAMALDGGEDYELLATGPREAFGDAWRVVGAVIEGDGIWVAEGGVRRRWSPRGWDHFRG